MLKEIKTLPRCSTELFTLKTIMEMTGLSWMPRSLYLDRFEIQLANGLGRLQVKLHTFYYLDFLHREFGESEQKRVVLYKTGSDVFVDSIALENFALMTEIRRVLESPLWHFVADQGLQTKCIFCDHELEIPSSRRLGYGPRCAERLKLYWYPS